MTGDETDMKAARLYLAMMPIAEITAHIGFENTQACKDAVAHGINLLHVNDMTDEARVEIDRLEALYRKNYALAMNGNVQAASMCLQIGERREKLLTHPKEKSELLAAFERTVEALKPEQRDEALVAAGRVITKKIDYAIEHGTIGESTKAMYLVPHLMNVLKELGATPVSRALLQEKLEDQQRRGNDTKTMSMDEEIAQFLGEF